jgi:hypothetical protein
MSEILKGNRVTGKLRAPRSQDGERLCGQRGCTTLLSRYNNREFCCPRPDPLPACGTGGPRPEAPRTWRRPGYARSVIPCAVPVSASTGRWPPQSPPAWPVLPAGGQHTCRSTGRRPSLRRAAELARRDPLPWTAFCAAVTRAEWCWRTWLFRSPLAPADEPAAPGGLQAPASRLMGAEVGALVASCPAGAGQYDLVVPTAMAGIR